MTKLGLEKNVINEKVYLESIKSFAKNNIQLPTFKELSNPNTISSTIIEQLKNIDPNAIHPLNLYRVNWYNDPIATNGFRKTPYYFELPKSITNVNARIIVMVGAFFPMIQCHKVLAAYGCLAPRIITGQFNPSKHKAIWPSTGNYCRGGIAISRIMNCHGMAVLPEEMSEERFNWLQNWVLDPENDIYKTYGCESNVKEIYDKCNELGMKEENIVFNQFCEFSNALIHYACTGKAVQDVFNDIDGNKENLKGYVSATGSAGTISAGDYLKDNQYNNCKIMALEALECPTLLYNGFGGHNIQGIGDKHIPYVHNIMNTDFVAGVSEQVSDSLYLLFNSTEGINYLKQQKNINDKMIKQLSLMGLSSICNMAGAIKMSKYYNMTKNDIIITIATDPASMYKTGISTLKNKYFDNQLNSYNMAETFGQYLKGINTDNMLELSHIDKHRIFNLGYYTWVEQQKIKISDFNARRKYQFWTDLRQYISIWDQLITDFNYKVKNQ